MRTKDIAIVTAFLAVSGQNTASATETKAQEAVTVTVPILTYHHIRPGRHAYNVRPEIFESQIRYLKEQGYSFITLNHLTRHLRYGDKLPNMPVAITFDDGWKNQYVNAWPILKKYGAVATFFVTTNALDEKNCLSWEQISEMAKQGMEIGSHTRNHPFLTKIGPNQLKNELTGSKNILESHLETKITTFAYPYGAINSPVITAVMAAGYMAARGVHPGKNISIRNIFNLPTIIVPDNLETLIKMISK